MRTHAHPIGNDRELQTRHTCDAAKLRKCGVQADSDGCAPRSSADARSAFTVLSSMFTLVTSNTLVKMHPASRTSRSHPRL